MGGVLENTRFGCALLQKQTHMSDNKAMDHRQLSRVSNYRHSLARLTANLCSTRLRPSLTRGPRCDLLVPHNSRLCCATVLSCFCSLMRRSLRRVSANTDDGERASPSGTRLHVPGYSLFPLTDAACVDDISFSCPLHARHISSIPHASRSGCGYAAQKEA